MVLIHLSKTELRNADENGCIFLIKAGIHLSNGAETALVHTSSIVSSHTKCSLWIMQTHHIDHVPSASTCPQSTSGTASLRRDFTWST